jgi:hypothetical protein
MLRIPFAPKAIAIAILFSGCGAGASELPSRAITAELLEPPGAAAAPATARLPAVPALPIGEAEQAPIESAARSIGLDIPAKLLREIQLPAFSLPQFEIADGPQATRVEFDELDHLATIGVRNFDYRSWRRTAFAPVEAQPLEPPVAAALTGNVENPREPDSFAAAMAAIAAPTPELEPAAESAPLLLADVSEPTGLTQPDLTLTPRRRPQEPLAPAPTAEGGPELPVLFELRRSAH